MRTSRFFSKNDPLDAPPKHDHTAWLKGGNALCEMPPRIPMGKAWRIVLLGAPGVGKGTQGELLSERLGACHLSTGDIFRTAKCLPENEQTESMKAALTYMRRGALVPDETVLDLIRDRLRCLRCSGGFLLDGFPCTVAQAEALEQLLDQQSVRLTVVLKYQMPADKIIARIGGRRICANCRAVYHLSTRPPKVADLCDHCGNRLYQREDDLPEAVEVRMKAYETSTRPLIDYYQQRNLLVIINAEGSPEDIYRRTRLLALDR